MSAGVVAIAGLTVGPSYAADDAKVYFVQGLPGDSLDVAVDGKTVAKDVKTAAVVGPFKVKAGSRKVTFSDNGKVVLERMFTVKADSSWDVVVHLPASSSAKPGRHRVQERPVAGARRQGVAGRRPHGGGAAGRYPGQRQGAVREHRERRVVEVDRAGGDLQGRDRARPVRPSR